jgi:hypothetical protein
MNLNPIKYFSGIYGLITGGTSNTAFGQNALRLLKDGNENTAIGANSMEYLVGANGGDPNLVGSLNTGIGSWTGRDLTIGIGNFFGGQKAGNAVTSGSYNVMIGKSCGEGIRTGGWNVFLGSETGKFSGTNSVFNTWIGSGAGKNNDGSNSILIGANSGSRYQTVNELVAGDSTTNPVNNLWFGKGKFSGSPTAYTINGTSGWGTDITGGNIIIAGGKGTGFNGQSGRVIFQISKPASGGTQQHYLVDVMQIASETNSGSAGNIGINKAPTNTLDIVNTTTNKQVSDTVVSVSNLGSSFFTFGGVRTSVGIHADSRSTNASGNGNLRNIGIFATASRGTSNYAAILDSGNVGIGVLDPLFKLDVEGVSNFRSRLFTTSLDLNKDSLPFATSLSKMMLIDTITGLATKANIGAGLTLSNGTLSATGNVIGGSVSTAVTAVQTFVVTIPTQANANYKVSVQGRNALSAGGWVTNQTATSFDYVLPSAVTGTVAFHWILVP